MQLIINFELLSQLCMSTVNFTKLNTDNDRAMTYEALYKMTMV